MRRCQLYVLYWGYQDPDENTGTVTFAWYLKFG